MTAPALPENRFRKIPLRADLQASCEVEEVPSRDAIETLFPRVPKTFLAVFITGEAPPESVIREMFSRASACAEALLLFLQPVEALATLETVLAVPATFAGGLALAADTCCV